MRYILTDGEQEIELSMPAAYALATSGYIQVTTPPDEPTRRFEVCPEYTWSETLDVLADFVRPNAAGS